MQELLSKAHTSDTGVEASKVQSLICIEEQCLFEAGRISMKATEDWRYSFMPSTNACSLLSLSGLLQLVDYEVCTHLQHLELRKKLMHTYKH